MNTSPLCKDHGKPLQTICTTCENLVCINCYATHTKNGCGNPIDLVSYASEKLLGKYKSKLDEFSGRQDMINESFKQFKNSSIDLKLKLIMLKDRVQTLLNALDETLNSYPKYTFSYVIHDHKAIY